MMCGLISLKRLEYCVLNTKRPGNPPGLSGPSLVPLFLFTRPEPDEMVDRPGHEDDCTARVDKQPRIAIYTVINDAGGYDDCQQDKNPFCSYHTFCTL